MNMQVTHITIVHGKGASKVMLHTNLPDPCYPFTGLLSLSFDAAAVCAEAYCQENWPGVTITQVSKS